MSLTQQTLIRLQAVQELFLITYTEHPVCSKVGAILGLQF